MYSLIHARDGAVNEQFLVLKVTDAQGGPCFTLHSAHVIHTRFSCLALKPRYLVSSVSLKLAHGEGPLAQCPTTFLDIMH